ncbi:MAG: hypothetical protein OXP66_08395 [Candidatus Tectomicrobia bacterium]|nr:hypothetical protein [Candidatus Tectomicrobia bacterium]
MKNVTITLPEDLARWLRIRAAENDRSVSKWLAELLEKMRQQEDEYETAMKRALSIPPRRMEWVDGRKPSREVLHDERPTTWQEEEPDRNQSQSPPLTAHEEQRYWQHFLVCPVTSPSQARNRSVSN